MKKQHTHQEHEQHDEHSHSHSNTPTILFFIGLLFFAGGFFFQEQSFLANMLFLFAMLSSGYHVIGEGFGDTYRNSKAAKSFRPNVHFLMTLAAAGAAIIGNFEEGALLIVIFSGAHFLEDYAEDKSRKEITNLLKLNPTHARLLLADGQTEVVSVDKLKIGDRVQVLNGDQVPTDGVIIEGISAIDESAINGESIPKEKQPGDEVFGSTVNGNGHFIMEVTKDSQDTVFAKILTLVNQSQQNLTKTGTLIQKLEPIYVTIILVALPFVVFLGPVLFNWTWDESFYKGILFLIAASPCALAASAIPTTLSAISNLAKRGVLFKGGSYLSMLAEVEAVAFDKTGTLTKGQPEVTDSYFMEGLPVTKETLLDVIVSMEKQANHPLATAILRFFTNRQERKLEVTNQIGKGLTATFENHTYSIGKPASFTKVSREITKKVDVLAKDGKTVVLVSIDERVIGLLALMDRPQEKAQGALNYFKNQGIHTTMITGDAKITGEAVGRQLGIDEVIANVLPEDKAQIIQQQQAQYGVTAMLGDGVNDAPALVTADVGVAMGEGTDVAIDVADAVLMKNDLSKLAYAHQVAQKMERVIWQNIIFSMGIVAFLMVMTFLGKSDIAIGVIVHEGSTLIVILNGLRLLIPGKIDDNDTKKKVSGPAIKSLA